MSEGREQRPRISVLIPTLDDRPGLEHAIASVLEQDRDDFELVISDDGAPGSEREAIETTARDPRVRVVRPERPNPDRKLPISENWNSALGASAGEYVLLLGDDDALMPGSLDRLASLLKDHGNPDCLSYNGYRFMAADAMPDLEHSYYEEVTPYHLTGELSRAERRTLVRGFFRFQLAYGLGYMQLILVGRGAMARLANGLFRPPFPDFYALAALMLRARHWVHAPDRLAVVGISRTSVASHVHQGRRDEGMKYLGERIDFPGAVPGNAFVNAMQQWLLALRGDYPEELGNLSPDRGEYLTRQLWSWYRQRSAGLLSTSEMMHRARSLGLRDWASLSRAAVRPHNLRYLASTHRHRRELETHLLFRNLHRLPRADTMPEFRQRVADEPIGVDGTWP